MKKFPWQDDVREIAVSLKNKLHITDIDVPNLKQMNGLDNS